jgi:hypothetical protein
MPSEPKEHSILYCYITVPYPDVFCPWCNIVGPNIYNLKSSGSCSSRSTVVVVLVLVVALLALVTVAAVAAVAAVAVL